MMRSRRISLAVKVNVMVIVLVLFVSTVLIMISEHAYREASFKPYIRKLEKITVQEDTLKPGLRYLIPYLNSEKHCFVIGGRKGIRYREYELDLAPGAKLFLYTDGLPEARNAEGEMFGLSRMIRALKAESGNPPERILANMQKAVNDFVKDAAQSDDLTMLCLEYKGVGPIEAV